MSGLQLSTNFKITAKCSLMMRLSYDERTLLYFEQNSPIIKKFNMNYISFLFIIFLL